MHASRGRRKPGPKLSERKRGYVWLFGLKRAFCDARFFLCPCLPSGAWSWGSEFPAAYSVETSGQRLLAQLGDDAAPGSRVVGDFAPVDPVPLGIASKGLFILHENRSNDARIIGTAHEGSEIGNNANLLVRIR